MAAVLDTIAINQRMRDWAKAAGSGNVDDDGAVRRLIASSLADDSLSAEQFKAMSQPEERTMSSTSEKIFSKGAGGSSKSNPRVLPAADGYSDVRHEARHVKTNRPVFDDIGNEVRRASQRDLAQSGVFLKYAARRAGISVDWSEHDSALMSDLAEKSEWASYQGEPGECKIFTPGSIRAPLLDDSTSGGLEAAPIVFDDMVITTPLLTGELFPEVQLVPIARGRRIEAASVATPSVVWNEGDNSSGTIFDSTGQITPLDSTVFDVSCHVQVGRNFLSDSPLQIGTLLVGLIGDRMAEAIESVIAEGDGVTQPMGIMTASGTTSVSFGNVASTVAKWLELLFSVPKNLRGKSFSFCSNEVTYRRARAIATGVSGDSRLVFGMGVEDFKIFERNYKICPALSNNQAFAGELSRYRLYRRLGTSVEWTTGGQTLQSKNLAMLTVRQRWAGRPTIPSAFAITTTAEG